MKNLEASPTAAVVKADTRSHLCVAGAEGFDRSGNKTLQSYSAGSMAFPFDLAMSEATRSMFTLRSIS
jgi:hypothetical protein